MREEILTGVALSVEQPFYRPKEKQAQADAKKAQVLPVEGDHLMLSRSTRLEKCQVQ